VRLLHPESVCGVRLTGTGVLEVVPMEDQSPDDHRLLEQSLFHD